MKLLHVTFQLGAASRPQGLNFSWRDHLEIVIISTSVTHNIFLSGVWYAESLLCRSVNSNTE